MRRVIEVRMAPRSDIKSGGEAALLQAARGLLRRCWQDANTWWRQPDTFNRLGFEEVGALEPGLCGQGWDRARARWHVPDNVEPARTTVK